MNKVIFVVDPHASSSGTSVRVDNYADTCLTKLSWVFDYAYKNHIDTVITPGDVLHNSDNSDEFMNRLIEVFHKAQENGISIYSTVGNHDIRQTNTQSFWYRQFGFLVRSKCFDLLETAIIANQKFVGLSAYKQLTQEQVDFQPTVLVCHHFIGPFGDDPLHIKIPEIKQTLPNIKYILAGHDHSFYGTKTIEGVKIIRPGSLMRVTSVKESNRIPNIAVIDFDTDSVEYVPVSIAKPFSEVFTTSLKESNKQIDKAVDRFVDNFSSVRQANVSVESIVSEVFRELPKEDEQFINFLKEDISNSGFVLEA